MPRPPKKLSLAVLAAAQVVAAALAWRDLSLRTDEQVRGKKRLWRLVIAVHPGNSLAYWMFGRRRGEN